MRGKQIVVYGHSGSGKTTLLQNELTNKYGQNIIKTNCMADSTYESVLLDAFNKLSPYYTEEKTEGEQTKVGGTLSTTFAFIKSQLSGHYTHNKQDKQVRALPLQLNGSTLAELIGESGSCWLIEDFHKIQEVDKAKFSQLMKVFMDCSDDYPQLKIIAVGAVLAARQVVHYDSEMNQRVAEIEVPLMKDEEIEKIITNGGDLLKIQFEDKVIEDVINYSNGVASIAHDLCYLMCSIDGIEETLAPDTYIDVAYDDDGHDYHMIDYQTLTQAITEYLEEKSDTISAIWDKALTIELGDQLLYSLTQHELEGATAQQLCDTSDSNQMDLNLEEAYRVADLLCKDDYSSMLRFDAHSHRYAFHDPFLRTFATMFFRESENQPNRARLTEKEFKSLINKAFSNLKDEFKSTDVVIHITSDTKPSSDKRRNQNTNRAPDKEKFTTWKSQGA
jgi:GTPase SAR1 family protein